MRLVIEVVDAFDMVTADVHMSEWLVG